MKFSTREDIEAPIEYVFSQTSNFESFEKAARRNGADVKGPDHSAPPAAGMAWDVRFEWRGKRRQLIGTLTEFAPPELMQFDGTSSLFKIQFKVTLVRLSAKRTRLLVELELRPNALAGRLLIQSMKLTKSSISRRFSNRVKSFADGIATKHHRTS